MEKHDKLIKKLRDLHRDPRPASAEWLFENQVALYDAAAAIEELMAQVKDKDYLIQQQAEEIERLRRDVKKQQDKMIELAKKLPKRGEIVLCKECIHFTQGGWCDREFDWFPVDENDFCSMAEKMEVQDA